MVVVVNEGFSFFNVDRCGGKNGRQHNIREESRGRKDQDEPKGKERGEYEIEGEDEG